MKLKAMSVACAAAFTILLVGCGTPPGGPPTTTTTTTIPSGSTQLISGDTVALGQFPVGVEVDRHLSIPGGGALGVTGGALPDGLVLGADGHLTGTPTTSTLFYIEVNDAFEAWGGVTTDDADPLTNNFAYVPAAAPPKDVLLTTSFIGPFGGGISGSLVHEADGDVRPMRFVNIGFRIGFESGGGQGAGFGTLAFPSFDLDSACDIRLIDLTHGNPTGFVGSLEGLSLDSTNCESVVSADGSTLIVFEMGATDADWTVHFYANGSLVPDSSVAVSGVRPNRSVARDGSNVVLTTVDPLSVSNSLVVVDRATSSVTTVPATEGGSSAYVELIGSRGGADVHDGDTVGVALSRSSDSSIWFATVNASTGAVQAVLSWFDDTVTSSGGFVDGSLVPVTQRASDGSNTVGILDLSTGSVTTLGNWTDNFFNYGQFLN